MTSSSLVVAHDQTMGGPAVMNDLIRYQLKAADVALLNNNTQQALNLLRLAELETSMINNDVFLFMNLGNITDHPNLLSDITNNNPTSDGNEFLMQNCFPAPSEATLICMLPGRLE